MREKHSFSIDWYFLSFFLQSGIRCSKKCIERITSTKNNTPPETDNNTPPTEDDSNNEILSKINEIGSIADELNSINASAADFDEGIDLESIYGE